MNTRHHSILLLLYFLLHAPQPARAAFQPIPLTPESYNQDIIVEKDAPPPVVPATTASMEQGTANRGSSWFERGYLADWPVTGLPAAGSVFASLQSPDHQYQMAASYQQANAVLIDSVRSNATITFPIPTNCAALSFLTSSGLAANTLRYTVWHEGGGSESGAWISPNWYSLTDPAWVSSGRVDVSTFAHADITAYNPRLYSVDVPLANSLGPIASVDLSWATGNGHTAIFAVSGAAAPGTDFLPLDISGYNEDLVVEAGATQPGYLVTNTTATMDSGTANTRFTWFEQGYYPAALQTGLPSAGSIITSESEPDHRFELPASYSENNAVLLDSSCTSATLTFAVPVSCSALSLLTASTQGPLTNQCILGHQDGGQETNCFVSPDWLATNVAPALTARGRVSVSTKIAELINTTGPRLYAVDVPVTDTHSPVVTVSLAALSRRTDARTIVLAISGAAPETSMPPPAVSIEIASPGRLTIHSTRPGRVQSCAALDSAAAWTDEGPIEQSLELPATASSATRFYRVVCAP